MAFSAAKWSLSARDKYIGWSEETRIENLRYVVTNDRFLIVPTVRVENLASHVLAMALRRLPEDFYNRPQANIPEACGTKARILGSYRFFQNEKITMDVILTPHVEATIERIKEHKGGISAAGYNDAQLRASSHGGFWSDWHKNRHSDGITASRHGSLY